ncbi:conserved hypothetical protein [Flavobacterium psychrophilum]|uniref:RteC domain-containing protein n=1 Tax=Flavobacterium psychrophilum TaxID=96345 RepID=UPI000B7C2F74|nr:RteC domain-containing protein [Flavobacterium psychrophilum]SNB15548.1 conserved hypothetical protein [Flavobacterium psychrophilum]
MKKEIIYNYKEFVKCYSELLQKFLLIDTDYEELDFIKLELENYKTYYANTITQYFSEREYFDVDNNFFVVNNEAYQIVSEISDYANKHIGTYENEGYDLLAFKFKKIIEFLEQKKYSIESKSPKKISDFLHDKKEILKLETETPPTETAPTNSLNWNGTQTDFIELVKALVENGTIKGTQTEIIKSLSKVFNIKINNENKLINDIKTRNNGSETLFIDKLKKSLFDYITIEKKK